MTKYFIAICFTGLLFTLSVFSQGVTKTHKVTKGENINQIAQLYKVTPFDIYQLNPDAQSGLKPNSVLLIPAREGVVKPKAQAKIGTHIVLPKETLYGIEKKYNVSDEALKEANPSIEKNGLEIGQTLIIPSKKSDKGSDVNPGKTIYHEVLPKETKYSISKLYGITIEELEKLNPEIISNLTVGYRLIIKGNTTKAVKNTIVTDSKKEVAKTDSAKVSGVNTYGDYAVKPKETLYGLSSRFGISQEKLIELNPALSNGLVDGMILKVPLVSVISQERQESKKGYVTLTKKSSGNQQKTLVLLLPFNITKIEGDTVNSTAMRLKKDKFLNMTLDFYSGALVAIDSAKQIGLFVNVKIFDSQETKTTSNVAAIIKGNNLETADAVIGPFYQANVEKTAELLNTANVPVISPLSKDLVKSYSNLYQTITPSTITKAAMFDYMRSKEGNIIAVIDKKKESVRKYIKENQYGVSFAQLSETGDLSVSSLKSLLLKDKMNYVVMESRSTGMIKTTVTALLEALATYRIQLVILEPNETLDTDEIDFDSLIKLKLMYPSMTRENESPEALLFEKNYKKKNKIFPSSFATRGFDITFDTMMRLSQDKKFEETADAMATEQVDNKFEYYKKEEGGYVNKGAYILYYDTDLTIKETK